MKKRFIVIIRRLAKEVIKGIAKIIMVAIMGVLSILIMIYCFWYYNQREKERIKNQDIYYEKTIK